jgi:molecular chaperone GrpE (heat shock protein)
MQDVTAPRLAKWPFFLGDLLLLVLAGFLCYQNRPLGPREVLVCVVCVALGAFFTIWPFILEYQAAAKLVETGALTDVVSQVQNLEEISTRISGATGQWQAVQEAADKTARQAKEIADHMAAEVRAFNEFQQQANDNERATLRLEVDKLRRTETEWLQVLVRVLDHVHALHRAASMSRQQNVIEQMDRFQNACHDAVRRVGLTPFAAVADEQFDTQRHQVVGGMLRPGQDASVKETVATGYTFQGKLIRHALVTIHTGNGEIAASPGASAPTTTTTQPAADELSLE